MRRKKQVTVATILLHGLQNHPALKAHPHEILNRRGRWRGLLDNSTTKETAE
jgi:hypothetical protein